MLGGVRDYGAGAVGTGDGCERMSEFELGRVWECAVDGMRDGGGGDSAGDVCGTEHRDGEEKGVEHMGCGLGVFNDWSISVMNGAIKE